MNGSEEGGGSPGLAASVTVIRGPDVGTKHQMTGPKILIGRKRGELLLRDREISGIHASIELAPDGHYILRDLGSTNGTFLDGKRVTATEIRPGQQVKVGANYILFTVTEESAADTTRHASGEISGQMLVPPPPQELVYGRTAISAPEPFVVPREVAPATARPWRVSEAPGPFDADLGEPDLSGIPTTVRPATPRAAEPAAEAPALSVAQPRLPPTAPVDSAPAPPAAAMASAVEAPSPVGGLPTGVEPSIYGVYLLVERGKDRGSVFPVNRQVTVIGRSGTEVLIDDPDISRRHAALDVQGQGKYILRDLASTNGTLLNGVRIQTENIQANDKIRMGSTTIKLLVGDARVGPELARVRGGPAV